MSKSRKQYNVRCISLPARSHPVAIKIEEELNKLKSWEVSFSYSAKAEKIWSGLSGLEELYKCIGDLFACSLTQEALAQRLHENWVNEVLDGLLKYLDICSNTREVVLMIKESIHEIQSALRRSKCGKLSIETNVNAYICSRKKIKKEIVECLASLKQMEDIIMDFSPISGIDNHLLSVIRLLRETSLISTAVFNSLLSFLSAPSSNPKPTKWSKVLKLVQKRVAIEGQSWEANELEDVDITINNLQLLSKEFEHQDAEITKIESAQKKLETLDVSIEGFENALECLFRRLIHARVSLLNIFFLLIN